MCVISSDVSMNRAESTWQTGKLHRHTAYCTVLSQRVWLDQVHSPSASQSYFAPLVPMCRSWRPPPELGVHGRHIIEDMPLWLCCSQEHPAEISASSRSWLAKRSRLHLSGFHSRIYTEYSDPKHRVHFPGS